jgi:hypothetical protein
MSNFNAVQPLSNTPQIVLSFDAVQAENTRLNNTNAELLAALNGIFAQTAKHSRQWGQAAGAHAFASDPDTAKAFAAARQAIARAEGRK